MTEKASLVIQNVILLAINVLGVWRWLPRAEKGNELELAARLAEPKAFAVHWLPMPRKLKVYQTSQGFYDLALAAPSMKAALEAWGASSNLFHQGFAKEADDDETIAAAMAKPGIVLKRPVGSSDPFREDADLPTAASLDLPQPKREARPKKAEAPKSRKTDEKAERRAAAAFEKERQKRQKQREKEEAEAAKARSKREAAIEKAEAALEKAKRDHEQKAAEIEKDLAAVQRRAEAEDERWQELKERLATDLRKAGR